MSTAIANTDKTLFQLVARLSAALTGASSARMDEAIELALAAIGDYFSADRSYLFAFSADLKLARNTHEWCAVGVCSQKAELQQLDTALFASWMHQMQQGLPVAIDDVSRLLPQSAERLLLESQHIQSVIMLPMMAADQLLGIFGLDIVRSRVQWPQETIAALQLIAGNIAGGLMRQQVETKAERLAFYDELTALPNRRLLHELVQQMLASSARSGQYGALLLVDLDHFKRLNESHGHQSGNQYLQRVAEVIRHSVRDSDVLARSGGDEFVLALSELGDTSQDAALHARKVADQLLSSINCPLPLQNHRYQASVSIGISLFQGDKGGVDELLKQVEMAMYRAKAAGRNSVEFFDSDMQRLAQQRGQLAQDLHQAIRQQQFHLVYQPIIRQQQLAGVEALIRWHHPEQGFISPGVFIPFAEQTGLIVAIGDWVMKEACLQLVRWQQDRRLRHLNCAVNISAFQFAQDNFVEKMIQCMLETGVNPERLKLELTEGMLVNDIEGTRAKMGKLQTLGVTFSLDDFGTGYSSLSYLHKLPLSQLKIDQQFIRHIDTNVQNKAITKAIIALATSLELEVVAEGVETQAELTQLQAFGCASFQGFLFSRPLSQGAIAALSPYALAKVFA
ncbi:putative bifunctional diguanylate cyclase/phosphodiesterase [Alkalimonas mucilaginosa]|uniref:GGDEF domain-containing protein n=1 Tax=Alkalimonas mucilaginosa TaxID=3057676 RepID=A0ABU7JH19_9GAMM|nr:GGDEF domain-containing protein [Alkalimonas sp. MEB004]MEE2024785.1 GGDEF domain-containing protein [Alkalimonas sp. MEB004]